MQIKASTNVLPFEQSSIAQRLDAVDRAPRSGPNRLSGGGRFRQEWPRVARERLRDRRPRDARKQDFREPGPDEIRNVFLRGFLLIDLSSNQSSQQLVILRPAGWNFHKSSASNPCFRSQPPRPTGRKPPTRLAALGAPIPRWGRLPLKNRVASIGTQSMVVGLEAWGGGGCDAASARHAQ
jgi:hypothetical protein